MAPAWVDDSRREARSAEIQYVESSLRWWVSRLQVLIPLALISLAAAAPAETLTVTVDIPERYKRAASEKCQIDEGTRAMFIIRFTPALERYLHTGYRLLIDNKPVEQGNSVSNPKGSQLASDTFIWETENSSHEPDGVHEYQLELLDANTKIHDYVVGTPRSRKVTVCDNDEPPPSPPVVAFAAANSEVSEGAGTKDVAVTVDPAPQSEITLSYSVAGTAKAGSDYRLSDTVTVAPGVARVNIPITIIDDEIEDSGETVVLTLSGGADYTVGSLSRHILIITNDDQSPEASFAAASSTAEEGAGSHAIRIDLSPPPASGITIGYGVGGSAAAGSDYTSLSGSVTVPAGTSRVILPVAIADDNEVENSETVELTLTGGTGYTVGRAGGHTLTITDNDTPPPPPPPPITDSGTPPAATPATPPVVAATVSISDASAEEGEQVTFTVRSEPAASSPLTLSIARPEKVVNAPTPSPSPLPRLAARPRYATPCQKLPGGAPVNVDGKNAETQELFAG